VSRLSVVIVRGVFRFSNEDNVVVGYNDSTFAPNYTEYSNSSNGGAVFHDRGGLPGNQSGDNVLDVDRDGNFYYATLSTDGAGNSSVGVSKSTDGGVTFTAPVNASTTANDPASFQDKEWLVVDRSGEDSERVSGVDKVCCRGRTDPVRALD
jgi:hypothetical protein